MQARHPRALASLLAALGLASACTTERDDTLERDEATAEQPATCTPTAKTIDDTATGSGDGQISYTGAWSTSSASSKYGGTDHYTGTANASYTFKFTGTAVTLYGARASHHGIAKVSVDGGTETTVDLYAATRADQVALFTRAGLTNAAHTVTFRATGTHSSASSDNIVSVDKIDATACTTTTPPPTTGFVTRSGKNLMLDGKVWKFIGVNAFGLTGCRTGTPDTQAVMDAFFSSLPANTLTRTWAFKPFGTTGVDRAVATAAAHNQKITLALADGANYCNDGGHDAAFYAGGFRGAYFDWIRTVVPRYKDSKALAFWEIMNEPGNGSTDAVMRTFFDETAALIKSLDPNHLISSGSQAEYVSGTQNYAYVHGGPNIDLASLHEYDYEYNDSKTIVSGHFSPTLAAMSSINKPLYIGEVGVRLNNTCMTGQQRADVTVQKANAYFNGGAIGLLYWTWVSNPPSDSCTLPTPYEIGASSPIMTAIRNYVIP